MSGLVDNVVVVVKLIITLFVDSAILQTEVCTLDAKQNKFPFCTFAKDAFYIVSNGNKSTFDGRVDGNRNRQN